MKNIKLNELEQMGLLSSKITLDKILKKDLENNKVDINIMKCLADLFMNIYNNYKDHYLGADQADIIIPQSEILDSEEKEYLRNVIKPFRNEIKYIEKKLDGRKREYIRIHFENDIMSFKSFKQGKMYKNMVLDKNYTLEELGL